MKLLIQLIPLTIDLNLVETGGFSVESGGLSVQLGGLSVASGVLSV